MLVVVVVELHVVDVVDRVDMAYGVVVAAAAAAVVVVVVVEVGSSR